MHCSQVFIMYQRLQIQTNTILLHVKISCQETLYTECGEMEREGLCVSFELLYVLGNMQNYVELS